ncbi:MAG: response regulator transcription factor [Verrucomicrobiota bacterium]|jgi:DNA-binding NarL/FixJ family response regulator
MKILIADDHTLVRDGLKRILTAEFRGATFGDAGDTQQAIGAALGQTWDLVILDVNMPGRNGMEVLKEIKAQKPRMPVLILSMYPERQYGARALRAGAAGYLTKASAPVELVAAVKKALAGQRYVGAALAEQLASDLAAPDGRPLHERLSDRELEVFRLIACGKSVKEIASELFLSDNTVSTYRTRSLGKMNMSSNVDLIRYAFEQKLVE